MIPALDSEYWNNRYLGNEIAWDAGSITTPLKTYFDTLTNKNLRILIPGAGNAWEAEYLANAGFKQVYVCDLAPAPLENLASRCKAINKQNLLQGDFFELRTGEFDMIVEQTFFCALNPSLRKRYFEKVHSLLRPGGRLIGLLFNDKLNNDKPPFGGSMEEYPEYFDHLFSIRTYEPCYNSIPPRAGRELFINLEKK